MTTSIPLHNKIYFITNRAVCQDIFAYFYKSFSKNNRTALQERSVIMQTKNKLIVGEMFSEEYSLIGQLLKPNIVLKSTVVV